MAKPGTFGLLLWEQMKTAGYGLSIFGNLSRFILCLSLHPSRLEVLHANASHELICAKDSSRIGCCMDLPLERARPADALQVRRQLYSQMNRMTLWRGREGRDQAALGVGGREEQPLWSACLKSSPVQSSCPILWDSIPKPDLAGPTLPSPGPF